MIVFFDSHFADGRNGWGQADVKAVCFPSLHSSSLLLFCK